MPAYNAEKTLTKTLDELHPLLRKSDVLVDDCSSDRTVAIARKLGLDVIVHETNRGYGGNQKTLYRMALERGSDFVLMLHPDNQYDARAIPAMLSLLDVGIVE